MARKALDSWPVPHGAPGHVSPSLSPCSGMTPGEAEIHFLENAKKLSMYGVDLHHAKVRGCGAARAMARATPSCPAACPAPSSHSKGSTRARSWAAGSARPCAGPEDLQRPNLNQSVIQ